MTENASSVRSAASLEGPEDLPLELRPGGPGVVRALAVVLALLLSIVLLSLRRIDGQSPETTTLGRWEVTASLLSLPGEIPNVGDYRFTFVVPYEVLSVHRQPPGDDLKPGDKIYVGHFQPQLSRTQAAGFEADLKEQVLGGSVTRLHVGDVHRMALEAPLSKWSPVGIIDRCYPPDVQRYWALWTNQTNLGSRREAASQERPIR